jgi:hypothetical protein
MDPLADPTAESADRAGDGAAEATHPHPSSRRLVVAVIGAAVLAVLALVVVFAIGIRHVPDYPTLVEEPEPAVAGWIAYVDWETPPASGTFGPCVMVQEILGPPQERWCQEGNPDQAMPEAGIPSWLGADEGGHLLLAFYGGDDIRLLTMDVVTGEILGTTSLPVDTRPPDTSRRADGARLGTTYHDDGWAEVWIREPDGTVRTLLRDRGPDGYSFWNPRWSTRGDFVLVGDSEQRTIVVRAEGDPVPRVLSEGPAPAGDLIWFQPA